MRKWARRVGDGFGRMAAAALLFAAGFLATGAASAPDPTELERGRRIYVAACMACHGARGDGRGSAAVGMDPRPRDFTRGQYKWRSTVSGALPTDEDLDRSIRVGVPGTEMPAWGDILAIADRRAVIQFLKRFSPDFQDPDLALTSEDIVEIPQGRPFPRTPATITAGKAVYVRMQCAQCHGEGGRGDGPAALRGLQDDAGLPIRVADLSDGAHRSGPEDRDLYRSFTTGLNGTPMPSFKDQLSDRERWELVDYIRSLARERSWWSVLFEDEP